MEASENTRIDRAEPTVRALDDRLVIERLEVDDERSAQLVRERIEAGQSGEDTVRDAIEIGARVLEREGLAAEVDYVQREFERTSGHVREQFGEQASALTEKVQGELQRVFGDEGGVMAKALDAHAGELADQISRHFGEESTEAVQHRVRELVEKAMRESREELVRHLSSDDGANPLADFKRSVNQTVVEARRSQEEQVRAMGEKLGALETGIARLTEQTEAGRALAEAEEAGTRKGRSFEERVHEAIEAIAEARGDAAFHVGDEPGRGGTKKGDTVVEVDGGEGPATGRIAFEAKNSRLGKKDAWQELNGAMAEREASFAVLVVAGEGKVPPGREQLHEYEGNKLIVAVDPDEPAGIGLELAYRYARCRLVLQREGELDMEAPAVRDAAAEALSALKQAQGIKLNLTKAENGIASARDGLEEMAESVKQRLERIESLVEEALPPGDDPA
jgi:hypothetical protein